MIDRYNQLTLNRSLLDWRWRVVGKLQQWLLPVPVWLGLDLKSQAVRLRFRVSRVCQVLRLQLFDREIGNIRHD